MTLEQLKAKLADYRSKFKAAQAMRDPTRRASALREIENTIGILQEEAAELQEEMEKAAAEAESIADTASTLEEEIIDARIEAESDDEYGEASDRRPLAAKTGAHSVYR